MEIRKDQKAGVAVLALTGRIDTAAAPELEKELIKMIEQGNRKILLNFTQVTYISSGGLRVLLATAKKLRSPDDRFGLSSLSPEVNKILKLAGFTTIFSIFPTNEDAFAKWQ
ncbi:MAG TPA: STAS domain-containing protein [Methanoregulaceae archaeon]|nr:STAS domain-containing protein [Methanoregulaceae archaeon]